jgi:hypothetical protein
VWRTRFPEVELTILGAEREDRATQAVRPEVVKDRNDAAQASTRAID